MNPILYPINQSVYTGNGVGILSDVTYCKATEVLNEAYELEFEISKDAPHASDILVNCAVKVRSNYKDPPQLFRIYSIEKNYDGFINVKAAHISYDTSGIPILPFTSDSLSDAVEQMNTNRKLLSESKFVLNVNFSSEGTLKVDSPSSFRSLLGGSENTILGVYGGEYHYNNYVIELLKNRGVNRGICFRYGKNITDFEQESNSEELYTAVLGYWKKSGNGDSDTIIYGNIVECEGKFPYDKIYILDTSSEIKNEGDAAPSVEQIDEYVTKYIADNAVGLPKNKMKIDYDEDDTITRICLGDTVGILYPEYNINATAQCNKVVFDCLLERNESIEIGVVDLDLSDSIAKLSSRS